MAGAQFFRDLDDAGHQLDVVTQQSGGQVLDLDLLGLGDTGR